jgi:hypothetical protein
MGKPFWLKPVSIAFFLGQVSGNLGWVYFLGSYKVKSKVLSGLGSYLEALGKNSFLSSLSLLLELVLFLAGC